MSHEPRIRLLTRGDVAFAHALRAQVGWNQTLADWERLLSIQPDGCFLAESEGQPVGTATTTVYGPELAWIGMVLVEPAWRRRGFGRALLGHCLRSLEARGVTGIKLDATPAGKQVYDSEGFRDEWALTRWKRPATCVGTEAQSTTRIQPVVRHSVVPIRAALDESLCSLDSEAFGIGRGRMLEALRQQSEGWTARIGDARSGWDGYGLRRPGSSATYLGPLVARDPSTALALAERLICGVSEAVIWDIPDNQDAARRWARASGFVPERPLMRMVRGTNRCPGRPSMIFGLAGPEIG